MGIGYCFSDKVQSILAEDNSRVLHIVGITQTRSFLQYQIQVLLCHYIVHQKYKLIKENKEAYPEVIPRSPEHFHRLG
jgi:hypothetical protein